MFPRLEPAQAGVALAPWAMPVAASPTPVVTQNISPDASALTAPSAAVTPPKATPSQAASLPKATPARTQAEILAEYNKQKAELEDLEIRMELPYWFLEFYDGKMTLERFDTAYCPNHLFVSLPGWPNQISFHVGIGDEGRWFVNCGIDLTYHDDERIADFSGNDPVLAKSLKQLDQEGKLSHFQFYESQDKSLLPRLQSEAVEAWKTYNPAKKKLLFDPFVEKPKLTPSTTVEERRWDYANLKVQSQGLEKKIQETESLLQ